MRTSSSFRPTSTTTPTRRRQGSFATCAALATLLLSPVSELSAEDCLKDDPTECARLSPDFFTQDIILPAPITGTPAVLPVGNGRLEIFGRGEEGELLHATKRVRYEFPIAWENLGGEIVGRPAAVRRTDAGFDVFVRGAHNDELVQRSFNPKRGWTGWINLGGRLNSSPSAVRVEGGRIHVFARGEENDLIQRKFDGQDWSHWESLGGDISSAPSVVAVGNRLEVFARGAHNDELVQRSFNGSSWSGWKNLGGDLAAAPSAVHVGDGQIAVAVLGTHDLELVSRVFDGTAWSGWINSEFRIVTQPVAYVDITSGQVLAASIAPNLPPTNRGVDLFAIFLLRGRYANKKYPVPADPNPPPIQLDGAASAARDSLSESLGSINGRNFEPRR